ncbi:MAG TPA: glycosyltransferase, partial [Petrotogaceae bacterium]|nr:glycosyltransferase [Petrotogaceae bacterium]
MLLSICMMVKNEERHLEECLQSLQPLVKELGAEIIVVDTGSTDSTVEIAKKYTDKLYFHEWN